MHVDTRMCRCGKEEWQHSVPEGACAEFTEAERPDAAPPKEVPQYITDFLRAVYPGNVELALETFDEKTALEDATRLLLAPPPSDAAPVADDELPLISFADIAAKFPTYPWEVADDQHNDYRVVRVAPTVDETLIIWVEKLRYAHPEDAPRPDKESECTT
ncbi:hypothetical protein LCGC14_3111560, partial [marine sediment metagenome]